VFARSQIGASVHASRFPRPFLSSFLPPAGPTEGHPSPASVSCSLVLVPLSLSLSLSILSFFLSEELSCRRESRRNKFLIKRTRVAIQESRARARARACTPGRFAVNFLRRVNTAGASTN
jgi:hypothetical protein